MLYSRVRLKRSRQTQASLQGRIPDDVDAFPTIILRADVHPLSARGLARRRRRLIRRRRHFFFFFFWRDGEGAFIASPYSSCSSPAPRRRPSLLSFVSISRRRNLRSLLFARPRRPRRRKRRRSPTRGRRRSSVLPFSLRNHVLDVASRSVSSEFNNNRRNVYARINADFFLSDFDDAKKKVPQNVVKKVDDERGNTTNATLRIRERRDDDDDCDDALGRCSSSRTEEEEEEEGALFVDATTTTPTRFFYHDHRSRRGGGGARVCPVEEASQSNVREIGRDIHVAVRVPLGRHQGANVVQRRWREEGHDDENHQNQQQWRRR